MARVSGAPHKRASATMQRESSNAARPYRMTRSQSRDRNASEEPPERLQRTLRAGTRQSSIESDLRSTHNGRATMEQPHLPPVNELSAIDEDYMEVDPNVAQEITAEDDHSSTAPTPPNVQFRPDMSRALSEMSQMTGRTTFSQVEMEDLDTDAMLGNLLDLNLDAEHVIGIAAPKGATHDALRDLAFIYMNPNSVQHRRLNGALTGFNAVQPIFGSQIYIRQDLVLRKMANIESDVPVPSEAWRIDDLLHKANLANLVLVAYSPNDNTDTHARLNTLDLNFPNRFMLSLSDSHDAIGVVGESLLLQETAALALEIRTQLLIFTLTFRSPELSPDYYISAIFMLFNEDVEVSDLDVALEEKNLRDWELLTDQGANHSTLHTFQDTVIDRVRELRDPFLGPDADIDAGLLRLKQTFPWESVQILLLQWAQRRNQELDSNIVARGGADEIVDSLDNFLKIQAQVNDQPAADLFIPASTLSASKKSFSRSNMGVFKARLSGREVLKETQPTANNENIAISTAVEENIPEAIDLANGDWAPLPDIENSDADDELSAHVNVDTPRDKGKKVARDHVSDMMEQRWKDNIENRSGQATRPIYKSLLDPQPNAQRVQWDDEPSQSQLQQIPIRQTQNSAATGPRPSILIAGTSSNNTSKRPWAVVEDQDDRDDEEEGDPSQDVGFQTDSRAGMQTERRPNPGLQRQSPRQGVDALPRTSHRTLVTNGRVSGQSFDPEVFASSSRPRRNPGQSTSRMSLADPETDEPRTLTQAQRNQLARAQAHALTQYVAQRPRQGWSEEEDVRLCELIAEHGPAYSHIKSIDNDSTNGTDGIPILNDRSAEQLRWHARDLKFNYLKAGMNLPDGFENVNIDKKYKDKLDQLGIIYDQEPIRSTSRR